MITVEFSFYASAIKRLNEPKHFMKNILIAGGRGMIGSFLTKLLLNKGYNVAHLSRKKTDKNKEIKTYFWQPEAYKISKEAIQFANCIINLSGENIGVKRWTYKQKEKIIESRTNTTLFENVQRYNPNLELYISASATGYYGAVTSEEIFTEKHKPANDFLGKVCELWEKTSDNFKNFGIPTTKIRIGVVLSPSGGMLPQVIKPVKYWFGAALGSGKQYIPWIHIKDLACVFLFILENKTTGVFNAVAPEHVDNLQFTKTLAKIMKKPFLMPNVPSLILRTLFGEMADIILKGSRVDSEKIQKAGFKFDFPQLEEALFDLLKK